MVEFPVNDADGHITESTEQLRPYFEGKQGERGAWAGRRSYYPEDGWDRSMGGTLGSSVNDAKSWLRIMDEGGMETTILYPTGGLSVGWGPETGFRGARCHATVRGPHFFGADGFDKFVEVHTLSHPVAQMIQLTGMIFEGVPEKYPSLRIGFMEAGCSWLPFWMDRMDEEWSKRKAEAPLCRKKPSDYLRSGQLFFAAEGDEKSVPEVIRRLGNDIIFYASDVPHWDHDFPENIRELATRDDLSNESKRKILYENTRRLYELAPVGSFRSARQAGRHSPRPGPGARSRPCAMFTTRRLVSPKLSRMSHTGMRAPMKLAMCTTGRSGVVEIVYGRTASAWAWTTACTSGRAS